MESFKDLAVDAMADIEMHPETWNQRHWRCNTGGCLAGHMIELSKAAQWYDPTDVFDSAVIDINSGLVYTNPQTWIVEALGMRWTDAQPLFAAENKLDHLRAGVKALVNDEPVNKAIRQVWQDHLDASLAAE